VFALMASIGTWPGRRSDPPAAVRPAARATGREHGVGAHRWFDRV